MTFSRSGDIIVKETLAVELHTEGLDEFDLVLCRSSLTITIEGEISMAVVDFFHEIRQWWVFLQDYWWVNPAKTIFLLSMGILLLFRGDCVVFSRKKQQCGICGYEDVIVVWVLEGKKKFPICKFCLSEFMKEGRK